MVVNGDDNLSSRRLGRVDARRLLGTALPLDSDFAAFCLDYFPIVSRRFASNMDRTTRTNILLESASIDEIIDRLRVHDPRSTSILIEMGLLGPLDSSTLGVTDNAATGSNRRGHLSTVRILSAGGIVGATISGILFAAIFTQYQIFSVGILVGFVVASSVFALLRSRV